MNLKNLSLQTIATQFQICQPIISVEPVNQGLINNTFCVQTATGKYILQQINCEIFNAPEYVMQNIVLVAKHLQVKNYPRFILSPIDTINGKNLFQDESQNHWRLFPFIEQTVCLPSMLTEKQAYQAAKAFGEYLGFLSDIEVSELALTIPDFHHTEKRFQQFIQAIECNPINRVELVQTEIDQLLNRDYIAKQATSLLLPIRVVHNDTKISNVLLDKQTLEVRCIIDLDTLMPGKLTDDFGDLVRTSISLADENEKDLKKVVFREPIFKQLAKGFLEGLNGQISKMEIESLAFGAIQITYEQALRFLTDYINGDVYYQTHYEGHNLVRAKNQIKLLSELEKHKNFMEEVIATQAIKLR